MYEFTDFGEIAKYSVFNVKHDSNGVEGYKEDWYSGYFYEDGKLSLLKHSDGRYSEYSYPLGNRIIIENYNSDDFLTGKMKRHFANGLLEKEETYSYSKYGNNSNETWISEYTYNENHHLLTKTINGFLREQNTYNGLILVKKELFYDVYSGDPVIVYRNPNRFMTYEY